MNNLQNMVWHSLLDMRETLHIQRFVKPLVTALYIIFPLLPFVIGLGFYEALPKVSSISESQRNVLSVVVIGILLLWWAVVTVLARQGLYAKRLPVRLSVILPPIIGIVLFTQIPDY